MSARKAKAPPKTPKKAAAESGGAIKPGGDSDSWEAQKSNQKRIANQYLKEGVKDPALKAKAGDDWDKMPEEVACSPAIYEGLAGYLCEGYTIAEGRINAGQRLDLKTATGVFSGVINVNHHRFTNPDLYTTRESLVRPRRPPSALCPPPHSAPFLF